MAGSFLLRPLAATAAASGVRTAGVRQVVSPGTLCCRHLATASHPGVPSSPLASTSPRCVPRPRHSSTTNSSNDREESKPPSDKSLSDQLSVIGVDGDGKMSTPSSQPADARSGAPHRRPAPNQKARVEISPHSRNLNKRLEELAKGPVGITRLATTIPLQTITRNIMRQAKPIPPMRHPVTSHEDFLKLLGRGYEEYAPKFKNWEHLFRSSGMDMTKMGIPIVPKKWILKFVELYRQGVDPFYIPVFDKAGKKARKTELYRKRKIELTRRRLGVKPSYFDTMIVERIIDI